MVHRKTFFWSEEEEKILRQLADRGCSTEEIKRVLKGRTVASIHCKVHQLGISLLSEKDPEIDFEELEKIMNQEVTKA